MADQAHAPFRADHVGSFLRPQPLREAMDKMVKGEGDAADLEALADKYVKEIVAFQEGLGLAVVTDGEFRHASFHNFLEKIDGVSVTAGTAPNIATTTVPADTKKPFEPRSYTITGKMRHARPIEVGAFTYLKSVSHVTPKVTMASPTMLLRAGRDKVSKEAYPSMEDYFADIPGVYHAELQQLGEAGCRYVQLDDTNYAYLCDPQLRARRQLGGDDPDSAARHAAQIINESIAKRPNDMVVAIHICRGNSAGQFAAQGGYEPVADILFNQVDVDGYFLEYDDERSGGFEPLRFFPKGSKKRIVLGLVSTKRPEIEDKDMLKRRIDDASKYVPLDNLCISPQCGFASTFRGNPVTEDIQRRKMERVVEVAREVWGTAA